jgi:hypothetical protein
VITGLVTGVFVFSLLAVFIRIHFIKRIGERDRSMSKGTESETVLLLKVNRNDHVASRMEPGGGTGCYDAKGAGR